jgi:ATP synthase protein I
VTICRRDRRGRTADRTHKYDWPGGRKFRANAKKSAENCEYAGVMAPVDGRCAAYSETGPPPVVGEMTPLLYFCGSTGPFRRPRVLQTVESFEVLTSVAVGRRLAQRAIAWQAVAIAVTALAFLAKGTDWALAAGLGGAAIALGGWLSSVIALGGGVNPSTGALARLLAGVALKWVVVVAVLLLGVGMAGLSPVPMLAGVIVALFAQLLAMSRPLARH